MDNINLPEIIGYIKAHTLLKQCMVILIYALLAKGCDILIDRGLRRVTSFTKTDLDDVLIECFHRPVYWSVFCVGLLHALLFSTLPPPWQNILPYFVKSVILFVWVMALICVLGKLKSESLYATLARRNISIDLFNLFRKILRVLVFVLGVLWGLSIWQVNLTPLFASAGIAGIAIALAVKDTLANFFGGISMFMDKTFKKGDYIILDSGERGEVVEIGMRSTRMKTRDDVLITVPNSILASTKVINESAPEPRFRIRIPVGVAYGSDIEKVEEVLLAIALKNDEVVSDPAARVRMRAFGNSSLDFQLLLWVNEPSVKGWVTHKILKEIYHIFSQENIEIPFPQMDVHLDRMEQ
jgi:MscS family membrane protein